MILLQEKKLQKKTVTDTFDPNMVILQKRQYKQIKPVFNTLDGAEVFLYREKSDYEGVPNMGPEYLYSYSITEKTYLPMATPDIQPNNGVIHALTPYYRWTYELKGRTKN